MNDKYELLAMAKRAKALGMDLMVDFHYSDSWADPAKQWTPAEWLTQSDDQLNEIIYKYTGDCLRQMSNAGAIPDFIQTGNEISYGMLWDNATGKSKTNYFSTGMTYDGQSAKIIRFANLLKAGADGVRSSNNSSYTRQS